MGTIMTASRFKSDIVIKKVAFAGVFAALTYVAFTFLSIYVPTPGGGVTVHIGNAFVALGALILGPFYGAVGGAIGLTISDLFNPNYLPQAPLTFVVKFALGFLVGVIAHKVGHISRENTHKTVFKWVIIAAASGMIFNAVVDPLARYWYKILVLGRLAADLSLWPNVAVTLINSVVSFLLIVSLYMALRFPLKKMGLLFEI